MINSKKIKTVLTSLMMMLMLSVSVFATDGEEVSQNGFEKFIASVKEEFISTFIVEDRYKQMFKGLVVTLEITVVAALLGILFGFIVATVRSTYDKTGKLGILNAICNVYLTVIRGTPSVIQLMIMYYIIFASSRNGILSAMLSFGINSGAYVAEIVRSGIMSIDKGQFEAGRSLGFNYSRTMAYIIYPQAFKNILPALGNEFIVLLKETSIAGYVALKDITYVGNLIRSRTYSAFFPLISVAVIYLVLVIGLSKLLNILERRLRSSER